MDYSEKGTQEEKDVVISDGKIYQKKIRENTNPEEAIRILNQIIFEVNNNATAINSGIKIKVRNSDNNLKILIVGAKIILEDNKIIGLMPLREE